MRKPLADLLREAIHKSGYSALALSKASGVSQPTISDFLLGADMRLGTAQKIADFLGVELVVKGKVRKKPVE